MNFLHEKHNLSVGDIVTVYRRDNPDETFEGEIYKILYKKIEHQTDYIDHIYIEFPIETYHNLLKRGSNVYYNNSPEIIGDVIRNKITDKIEKLHAQYLFRDTEDEINIEKINSMLIWRIAYNIVKK